MGHDVFISYSNRDKAVADAACARLEREGHRCWIAPRDILSGVEWGKAIVDGIRQARVFVLIFSAHANRSPQVSREVERAVSNGLPVIPFRIEDVVPSDSLEYFISNQHWLDAMTPPLDQHLSRLDDVVARLLGGEGRIARAKPPQSPRKVFRGLWIGGIAVAIGMAALIGWLLLARNQPANSLIASGSSPAPVAPPGPAPSAGPQPFPVRPDGEPGAQSLGEPSVPVDATVSINGARGVDPTAVVRQFYAALGQADGSTASGFVVTEKRNSGPFSAAALTSFYGALASPLEIVDIALLPDGRVRTRYHYRQADGRPCNGLSLARVTVSPDGIPLIAGIETPAGC
jgi:hypothetical protein